jgi:hypothetical protein
MDGLIDLKNTRTCEQNNEWGIKIKLKPGSQLFYNHSHLHINQGVFSMLMNMYCFTTCSHAKLTHLMEKAVKERK